MKRPLIGVVLLFAATLFGVACGDDDDDAAEDTAPLTALVIATAAPVTDTANAVTVVATDYKFSGLPPTSPAGTQFTLQNDSEKEVHEAIFFRIPDTETRPVGQLLALPDDEIDAIFGDAQPATVIVALPGERGNPVLGDGIINDPGRYAVLCFIPVGADPHDAMTAMSDPNATGVPGSGPPHVTEGMYAEITIGS